MTDDLLPCPFCGGAAEYSESTTYDHVSAREAQRDGLGVSGGVISNTKHAVRCTRAWHCYARVLGLSKNGAIAMWNTRAAQPAGSGGVPDAWLHTVVQDDGEQDSALSFSPDSFPLQGVGGFKSIGVRPLYAAAPASPQGWMPIDALAMDGRCVLLAKENGRSRAFTGYYSAGDKCWFDMGGHEREPTHWQPLPPPPSSGDGRGVA